MTKKLLDERSLYAENQLFIKNENEYSLSIYNSIDNHI